MARPFSVAYAKRIIEEHREIIEKLNSAPATIEQYKEEIEKSTEELVAKEVLSMLREIPIEEINRDKRGFRVKALRDHGYTTLADVASASVFSISSVYGISEDSAFSIKSIVNSIAAKARQGVKIRLSTDVKTKETTRIISAISKYKRSMPVIQECRQLLADNQQRIQYATEDVSLVFSGIKWFFASRTKKQKATDAYLTLIDLRNNEYGQGAKAAIAQLDRIKQSDSLTAWTDFANNPIQFFNILEEITPGILGNDDAMYGLPEDLAHEIQEECFFPDGLLC